MIGYLKPGLKKGPKELRREYKSVYCALCRALRHDYHMTGVATLNHEITFLLLLIIGLDEQPPELMKTVCSISPLLPVTIMDYRAPWFEQAAHTSLLIAGGEVLDNVRDGDGIHWRILSALMKPSMKKAQRKYPDESEQTMGALEDYNRAEETAKQFDELLEAGGDMIIGMLDPLICCAAREHQVAIGQLMRLLGKWLFLVDALDDYQEDMKRGRMNLIAMLGNPAEAGSPVIEKLEKEIVEALSGFPLRRYRPLIDHVIFGAFSRRLQLTNKMRGK